MNSASTERDRGTDRPAARAEQALFDVIEQARVEQARAGGRPSSRLLEYELLPAMRAVAAVRVGSLRLSPQVGAGPDDVISIIDERFARMIRTIDLTLDAPQIVRWIYDSIGMAIMDWRRSADPLSRRQRQRVKEIEARVSALEERLGRELTGAERRRIAAESLGVRQAAARDVERLVTMLTTQITRTGELDDLLVDEDSGGGSVGLQDLGVEESFRAQMLHIAGANIEDDSDHAAFAEMINGGRITNAGLSASLKASLAEHFEAPAAADLLGRPARRALRRADVAPALDPETGATRYYSFVVPRWRDIHDRVIDAVAVDPLGLRVGIDKSGDVTEVYVAGPSDEFWGTRRWRLFAIALAVPDMAGRREWLPNAKRITTSLPNGLTMQIMTEEMFERQMARLARLDEKLKLGPPGEAEPEDLEDAPEEDEEDQDPEDNEQVGPEQGEPEEVEEEDGFPRSSVRIRVALRLDLDAYGRAPLRIRRDGRTGHYVAVDADGQVLLDVDTELSARFDAEYADGAEWQVVRWLPPRGDGSAIVTMRRTMIRHGRQSSYQYHRCKCERCTRANTLAQARWRKAAGRVKPRATVPVKHGAGCAKRGCHCDARKKADRERQQRSRERRRREADDARSA